MQFFLTFFKLLVLVLNLSANSAANMPIEMVKNRRLGDANWGTHQVPLLTAVINTTGPVLELGCGDFSTTLLHAICAPTKRLLVSVECDKEWMSLFEDLKTDWHNFHYVPAYENCANQCRVFGGNGHLWDQVGNNMHWSVVFIDHAPAVRRPVDIIRLRKNTDIFVVHDTQYPPAYGYDTLFLTFKYLYTYQRYETYTTLLSDTIDVARLFDH